MPYCLSFLCCIFNGGGLHHSIYDRFGDYVETEEIFWDPVCPQSFRLSQSAAQQKRNGIYLLDLKKIRLADIYRLLSIYNFLYNEDEQCIFSKIFQKEVGLIFN